MLYSSDCPAAALSFLIVTGKTRIIILICKGITICIYITIKVFIFTISVISTTLNNLSPGELVPDLVRTAGTGQENTKVDKTEDDEEKYLLTGLERKEEGDMV